VTGLMFNDLRTAARSLSRSPGFVTTTVLTVALGVGTVTTVFSFVSAAALRGPRFPHADRIHAIGEEVGGSGGFSSVGPDAIKLLRKQARSFSRVSILREKPAVVATDSAGQTTRPIFVTEVDSGMMALIEVSPAVGRRFAADEFRAGTGVAIVSDSVWQSSYNGQRLGGQSVTVDGRKLAIVGVLHPGDEFYERSNILLPLAETIPTSVDSLGQQRFAVLGRIRDGVKSRQAQAELRQLDHQLDRLAPSSTGLQTLVLRPEMFQRSVSAWLPLAVMFLGSAACVLLVAAVNVGNLMLARSLERSREAAVRAALGASNRQLLRFALAETVVLTVAMALLGIGLTLLGVRVVRAVIPTYGLPSWFDPSLDWRVVGFSIGVTLLTALVFGAIPVRVGRGLDITSVLRENATGAGGGVSDVARGQRGIAAQLALSLSLFICAALLVRTYRQLTRIDPGYDTSISNVMLSIRSAQYNTPAAQAELEEVAAQRLQAAAQIKQYALRGTFGSLAIDADAAKSTSRTKPSVPLAADYQIYDGRTLTALSESRVVRPPTLYVVSASFFNLIKLPLTRGRIFDKQDSPTTQPTAIVSAEFARRSWGGIDPVGRSIRIGRSGKPIMIVGMVRDTRDARGGRRGLGAEPQAAIYFSDQQASFGSTPELLVRASVAPAILHATTRDVVRSLDAGSGVQSVETLAAAADKTARLVTIIGGAMSAFAIAALVLAAIGTYGLVAFQVNRRRREIGIRLALGASRQDVMKLVVSGSMTAVLNGALAGILLGVLASQGLRAILWRGSLGSIGLYVGVVVGFIVTALAACLLPAARILRVDPVEAMRSS
jgi:putative ABC transport system permease protein